MSIQSKFTEKVIQEGKLELGCDSRRQVRIRGFYITLGLPRDSVVKNPSASAGNTGVTRSVPGLGRSPGGGSGNPLMF